MDRKIIWLLAIMLLSSFNLANAQSKKLPRIGFLVPATAASTAARLEAFRQELQNLGYVEGRNISIEYRYSNEESDRIPELAAELVNLNVDLIVTSQTPSVLAIKKASPTMPVVFLFLSFPVENGIVASFARPGAVPPG